MTSERFITLAETHHDSWGDYTKIPGHTSLKADWLDTGRKLLRQLAKELGLVKGTFAVRKNAGGPAVSGEAMLHGDWVYVQLSQSLTGMGFMWRYCRGQKDYSGLSNNWARWSELLDLPEFAKKIGTRVPQEAGKRAE